MRRFLAEGDLTPEDARKKAAKERFTRLMQLLMDPGYRALHAAAMQALGAAERTADRVLTRLEIEIAQAEGVLGRMRDMAARLPDGTRVFRDAAGVVRREDGSTVDAVLAETILWRDDEPACEDVAAAQARLTALQEARDEVLIYQNEVLGPARDRMTDEDDPPSEEELQNIMDGLARHMPAAVRAEQGSPAPEAAAAAAPTASITLPPFGGAG